MCAKTFEYHDSQWDVYLVRDEGDVVFKVNGETVTFPKFDAEKYRDEEGLLSIEALHEMACEAIDELSLRCV